MTPDEALVLVKSRAVERDFAVSDAALSRAQARGLTAADLVHALEAASGCTVDGDHGVHHRFCLTGPSLSGTEIAIVVQIDHGIVTVV